MITTTTYDTDTDTADVRVAASMARGMRCGWYRTLFELGPVTVDAFADEVGIGRAAATGWIGRQVDADVLRVVGTDATGEPLVLLPGEHVTALLGDDLSPALDGAREMARAHAERIAPIVRELADTA